MLFDLSPDSGISLYERQLDLKFGIKIRISIDLEYLGGHRKQIAI